MQKKWKNFRVNKIVFLKSLWKSIYRLVTNRGGKLLNKRENNERKKRRSGSRDQSIPQMKSKLQLVRHKHACHPWELAWGWWLIRFLFFFFSANGREVESKMRKRETDIYILLDKMLWCPLKVMLQLPGGCRRCTKTCKEKTCSEGKKGRLKDKKEKRVKYEWNGKRGDVEWRLTG